MFNELANGIGKFIEDNNDLQLIQNGVLIHLLERGGRLHVMIEVDEDATQDDLRSIIPLACQWRDRVMEHQGAWSGGGTNQFLEILSNMQESGFSYAQIAESLNENIEKRLKEYVAYRQEVDAKIPALKSEHERDIFYSVFWLGMNSNSAAMSFAKDLLESLRYKQEDILEILKSGLDSILNGKSIFTKNYPITRYKVIEVLRVWRNGKKHKSILKQKKKRRG